MQDYQANGFRLDHFGNLIMVNYVDLRDARTRDPIRALIKGCKTKYNIHTSGNIQISTPDTFRDRGESLIRDATEWLHSESSVAESETESVRLVNLHEDITLRIRTTTRNRESNEETLSVESKGWIYCTSIEPPTDEEWLKWRATLEDGYSDMYHIYRPREFAFALGAMVAEQLGARSGEEPLKTSIRNRPDIVTLHPAQVVFHGPVAYKEDPVRWILEAPDEASALLRLTFTKSWEYRDQREYRFLLYSDAQLESGSHLIEASPEMLATTTRRGNDPLPMHFARPIEPTA